MRHHSEAKVRPGVAMLVAAAVGSLALTLAGTAHAAGSPECTAVVSELADTDLVKIDTAKVELGDGPLFGSRKNNTAYPAQSAAVCWDAGRSEAFLVGKLYWGSYQAGSGGVIIQAFDADGDAVTSQGAETISSSEGTRSVSRRIASHVSGALDAIRLTAYVNSNGVPGVVGTPVTVRFGD